MPARKPQTRYYFEITLAGRKGLNDTNIKVYGKAMNVNHRGDLLILETAGYDSKIIACYKSGAWLNAQRQDAQKPETT